MNNSTHVYIELFKRKEWDRIPIFQDETGLYYLSERQKQALNYLFDSTTFYVGYGGSGMSGKSQLECFWLTFMALAYPDTRWMLGRKELANLKLTTLQTLLRTFRYYGITKGVDYEYNDQSHKFVFSNESQIILKDTAYYPSDPEFTDLGGLELTGAALDESAENVEKVIIILTSRVGRWNNKKYGLPAKILEGFNPIKNHVHTRYWRPFRDKCETVDTKFVRALCTDNPHPDARMWAENILKSKDKRTIQRLYYGNFDYDDDDNSLMPFNKIQDLFTNSFVPDEGQMFISSDLALTNDDFVLIVWKGLRIKDVIILNNLGKSSTSNGQVTIDFSPLVRTFDEVARKWSVPRSNIIYDADGIGHHMKSFLPGAIALHSGQLSLEREYKNLKANLYYRLADAVNTDKIFFDCSLPSNIRERISDELQAVKRDTEPGEKLGLLPKIEIKKLLGYSPDLADAMAYRMLFQITRKT